MSISMPQNEKQGPPVWLIVVAIISMLLTLRAVAGDRTVMFSTNSATFGQITSPTNFWTANSLDSVSNIAERATVLESRTSVWNTAATDVGELQGRTSTWNTAATDATSATGSVAVIEARTSVWNQASTDVGELQGRTSTWNQAASDMASVQGRTSVWNTAATDATSATGSVAVLIAQTNNYYLTSAVNAAINVASNGAANYTDVEIARVATNNIAYRTKSQTFTGTNSMSGLSYFNNSIIMGDSSSGSDMYHRNNSDTHAMYLFGGLNWLDGGNLLLFGKNSDGGHGSSYVPFGSAWLYSGSGEVMLETAGTNVIKLTGPTVFNGTSELRGNMNARGRSISNLGTVTTTNLTVSGNAVVGGTNVMIYVDQQVEKATWTSNAVVDVKSNTNTYRLGAVTATWASNAVVDVKSNTNTYSLGATAAFLATNHTADIKSNTNTYRLGSVTATWASNAVVDVKSNTNTYRLGYTTSTNATARLSLMDARTNYWESAYYYATNAWGWGNHANAGYMTGQTNVFADIRVADTNYLGAELGSNGTFTGSAVYWSLSNCYYWSNRVQVAAGQIGTITPSNAMDLVSNRIYAVSVDRQTFASGETITISLGGESRTWTAGGDETLFHRFYTHNLDDVLITVDLSGGFNAVNIDNVSVKEVQHGPIRGCTLSVTNALTDLLQLQPTYTWPLSPMPGAVLYHGVSNKIYAYDGTLWQPFW